MRRVAVFARPPVPGAVKTRLSPALPPSLAEELYTAMLDDALAAASESGAEEHTLYWASVGAGAIGYAVPAGFTVRGQLGAGLGARLATAFAELLPGAADRAVVIGADCPDLDPTTIREAFAALETGDLVLGPARDGGYYLIGLRRPAPTLFEGMAWGTRRVLEETLARAERARLQISLLSGLADFDTPQDLVSFVARRSLAPGESGRQTEAALRAMGLLPPRP